MADGGGVKQAALRPVSGAVKVARFAVGSLGRVEGKITVEPTVVDGNSAMVIRLDGEVGGVMVIPVDGCPYHPSSLCQQPGEAEPRRIRDAATLR